MSIFYSSRFVTFAATFVAGICPWIDSNVAFAGFETNPWKASPSAHLRPTTIGVDWSANLALRSARVILTKLKEPLVRPLPGRDTLFDILVIY